MSKIGKRSTSISKSKPKKVSLPKPNPRRAKSSVKNLDKTQLSKETKKSDKIGAGTQSLLNGLQSWANDSETADKKGTQAASELKPLALDKGQFLRKGASGEKVTQLQELLNSKGASLDVDGKFGPKTLAALKKFQGSNELSRDGVVGPKTLAKLNGNEAAAQQGAAKEPAQNQAEPGKVEQGPGKVEAGSGTGRFANTRDALNKLPKPLQKYADTFQKAGEKYGVDPRFLAAISMHETGNGRSSAFRNKNNAMGISNRRGPIRMSSVEASIEKMARTLAKPNGYYRGKTTIGQIGKVYAPVGAANDPTGLNGYWAKGVAKNFRMFGGNPSGQVIFRG